VTWSNQNTLTFNGSDALSLLHPTVLPLTTGWYVVTITNDVGCIALDSVLIIVDPYKPIYIPNVITPNNDYVNDQVTVHGNVAATSVGLFQIYDRWGNMLWERTNFPLNDPSLGWDGTSRNKPVNPGVYAYVAVVEFLDQIPLTFHGTVTVLR
jgi:gliding motility-associated-like protein